MNREAELMKELGGLEQGEYFHFRAPLSKVASIVGVPLHQRDQNINRKKEIEWLSDMLIHSMHVKKQSSKKPNYALVHAFGADFTTSIAGNYQRFGIWHNTDSENNGYPKYSIEEGAHRRRYYNDFVADEVKIKRDIVKTKSKTDAAFLEKLFDFCNTDIINYTTLKDMGLTGLIDNIEVEIDMIKTDNPEIAAQMFRDFNNSIQVKGSDLRKNLYVNFYLYKVIQDFFDSLSTKDCFTFGGVTYTSDQADALRFILPATIGSKGKYFDIMCRCILANKDYKDGQNWTKNTKGQPGVAENLFKRYKTDRQHEDVVALEDFNDTMQKLVKLGEILLEAKGDGNTFLFNIGEDNHNYTTGAVALPSEFIMAYNDLHLLYPKATNADYANILKTFSTALVTNNRKYVLYNTTVGIIKDTPHNFTRNETAARIIIKIAKDILER